MLLNELSPIRQVAYVVRDIQKAMEFWTKTLGVGPFFYFDDAPIKEFTYRGTSTDAKLAGAFANTGSMQIEIAQPLDEQPSIFNDALKAGHEGQHHIAYWTNELDKWVNRAEAGGLSVIQSGYTGAPDGRFVYLESEGHLGTSIVEISEVQGRKEKFFQEVAKASANWTGVDPIRRMDI